MAAGGGREVAAGSRVTVDVDSWVAAAAGSMVVTAVGSCVAAAAGS